MKCGYCEREMVKGYIPAEKNTIYFAPEEVPMPILIGVVPQGAVKLSEFPMWKRKKATSFYCPNCHIVMTLPIQDKY